MGIAHSVEIWSEDELIGGLYGLCIGPFFFGESMFSHKTDASKIALIYLRENLVKQGLKLIDCQVENPHLMSLGAKLIPRETFCQLLDTHLSPMRATIFKGVFESSQTKCDDAISIWPSEWQIPDI